MPWSPEERHERLTEALTDMKTIFETDPIHAVRSQEFIKTFHKFIAKDLEGFLLPKALKAGVKVVQEAKIFGSYKSKDVDVAVIHPVNGPLICVGVRSQMSSIGKNVLTYYQDIAGEAISLQERFPMSVMGWRSRRSRSPAGSGPRLSNPATAGTRACTPASARATTASTSR